MSTPMLPPSDRRKVYQDLPALRSWSDFDSVARVKRALRALEDGMFGDAAQLVDVMGRDDRISGVMGTRVRGLLGLPKKFETRGTGRRRDTVAEDLETRWSAMFPETALADLLRWGLWVGVGVGELLWETAASRWDVKLKVWHPQYVWWQWDTRSYWVSTLTGPVEITPGNGKWVLFTPYGHERGWNGGLVRCLSVLWLVRQWGMRDWSRYGEVHGNPIKKGKVPFSADEKQKEAFFDDLKTLGSEALMLLEQVDSSGLGFDIDLLEAKANTWETFDKLLARADAAIAVAVLGQNLTTEVKSGSFAAAQVHDSIRQAILAGDAKALSTTLHEQAVQPWTEANYGDRSIAPYPCIETDPPEDKQAKATTLNTLATALQNFRNAGVNVDVEALLEDAGVPLAKGGPMLPPPEPAPAPEAPPRQLGGLAKAPPGVVAGQAYTDAIAAAAVQRAAILLHPDVLHVLSDIQASSDWDDMKARILARYEGMDAGQLAQLVEKATLLAELNGRFRVVQEN